MARIVECIPNFSEGRDKAIIESIIDPVRNNKGIKLLDYSSDPDHNRTVVTFIGSPESVEEAIVDMAAAVYEKIDMRKHSGGHPRMGALDVVPFVPISNVTVDECIEMSKKVGKVVGEKFQIPVYLYEDSATKPERQNLAKIRKGQYEGFFEKIKDPAWAPDFGHAK